MVERGIGENGAPKGCRHRRHSLLLSSDPYFVPPLKHNNNTLHPRTRLLSFVPRAAPCSFSPGTRRSLGRQGQIHVRRGHIIIIISHDGRIIRGVRAVLGVTEYVISTS